VRLPALPQRLTLSSLPRPSRPLIMLVVLLGLGVFEAPAMVARLTRWGYTVHRLGYSDFGQYYLWARIGWHDGWSQLYDLAVQRREWQALGGVNAIVWWPNIDPPPQAWLAAPFALLPFPMAFAAWMALILAAFLITWRLVSPGQGLARWAYLAAALVAFPVIFGLALGQALVLVAASVTAGWWFLKRGQQVAAGLVMLGVVLKPQLALLVPLALLVAGYRRTFQVWALGMAALAVLSIASLGPDGLSAYLGRLAQAASANPAWAPLPLSAAGLLGGQGLLIRGVALVIGLLTLLITRLRWHSNVDGAVATGLVGSMLVTPYVHEPDLAILLLAAAIFLHMLVPAWQRGLLVALYLVLTVILMTGDKGAWLILLGDVVVIIELVWLASLSLPVKRREATAIAA